MANRRAKGVKRNKEGVKRNREGVTRNRKEVKRNQKSPVFQMMPSRHRHLYDIYSQVRVSLVLYSIVL